MPVKAKDKDAELPSFEFKTGRIQFHIVGRSPLLFHAFSEKAKRDLLKPRGRLTAADKATNEKHNPLKEYRDSVYRQDKGPTLLCFPSTGFKAAMAEASLEIPGITKSSINRLVWVEGDYVDVYGVPELHMDTVRMADIGRTPDIRTRAILGHWAATVTIGYAQPKVTAKAMASLMQAAGLLIGIGDKRQGKGVGNHGTWSIVDANDKTLKSIMASGGRKQQEAALKDPTCYDEASAELFNWWVTEMDKKDSNVNPLRVVESEAA